MGDRCWLRDGCPGRTAVCSSCGPTDDGCPIYRWFKKMFEGEKMKILKHGNALSFYCMGCGCKWIANKSECSSRTKYVSCMPSGHEYIYNCPECGFTTVGTEIQAKDIHEGAEA